MGFAGESQTMFYAEVTDAMKVTQGKFLIRNYKILKMHVVYQLSEFSEKFYKTEGLVNVVNLSI